jgi:chromate transporter
MKNKPHKLWVLFLTTLYISAFTFGGGFVIVTFMKHKFVDELHWIDEQEMLDFTALAQSCPGAIAVNAAILVGWNVYGFAGMIVATLGTILPPMIILSVVSFFYAIFSTNVWVAVVLKGMQAGVAAVILDAACSLGESVLKEKSNLSIFIMTAAFVCDFFLEVNVVYIILVAACIGIIQFIWYQYRPFFLRQTQKETQKQKCLQETKL